MNELTCYDFDSGYYNIEGLVGVSLLCSHCAFVMSQTIQCEFVLDADMPYLTCSHCGYELD